MSVNRASDPYAVRRVAACAGHFGWKALTTYCRLGKRNQWMRVRKPEGQIVVPNTRVAGRLLLVPC